MGEPLIFGATAENIIDLLGEYEIRNGKFPMTSESIQQAFANHGSSQKSESMEMYSKKVLARLYDLLPLGGVTINYCGEIFRQGDTVLMHALRGRYFNLTVNEVIICQLNDFYSSKEMAAKVSRRILKDRGGIWVAFAAQALPRTENTFKIVYGIVEDRRGFDRRGEISTK